MRALVYDGDGASRACVAALVTSLRRSVARIAVRTVSWRTLSAGDWRKYTDLLVLPGGRDVPYVRLLARAAGHIRSFVAQGGRYLGSCAGAYFAASRIDFARSEPCAVSGARPLRLWPGLAVGPIGPRPFAYDDPAQAEAVHLCDARGRSFRAYTHGGCALLGRTSSDAHVVARYAQSMQPVAVRRAMGRGRVLLWGVHPEFDATLARRMQARSEVLFELTQGARMRQQVWAESLRWLLRP